jgi:hypothetical protein
LYPGLQFSLFDGVFVKEVAPLALSGNARKQSRNLGKYHALSLLKARCCFPLLNDSIESVLKFPLSELTMAARTTFHTPLQIQQLLLTEFMSLLQIKPSL